MLNRVRFQVVDERAEGWMVEDYCLREGAQVCLKPVAQLDGEERAVPTGFQRGCRALSSRTAHTS
jgi:hypothetical protein